MKNRQIKFRIWDSKNNKFLTESKVENNFHDGEKDVVDGYSYFLDREYFNDRFIFNQFIGLLDKNGQKIYEGDIINFEIYGITHGPERDYIKNAEVYYDEKIASFCFEKFSGENFNYTYQMIDRIDEKTLEIVGNIFEKEESLNTITDGYASWSKICPTCGKDSMVIVRPGSVACEYCG